MKINKPIKFPPLSPITMMVLKWGFAAVAAVLVYIAFSTASLGEYDAARLHPLLVEQIEHALMSMLLTVAGAVLLDIAVKENR